MYVFCKTMYKVRLTVRGTPHNCKAWTEYGTHPTLNIFLHEVLPKHTLDKSEIQVLPSHQQSQLITVFPKQLFLGVIFLTLSWINWNVPGEMWALSIVFTFGASSIDLGGDKAHCIAQIARGRIYISDL